jgi:DnaJ-domain-containing protein 1
MSFELQITGEQYSNLRGAFQTAYNGRRTVMEQMRSAGRDEEKVAKLIEEITQQQSKLEKRYAALLTSTQLERFNGLKAAGGGGGRGRRR